MKQQWLRYSTYWTTEAEGVRICFARVAGIGGGEGKGELNDEKACRREVDGVWTKTEAGLPAGCYLQACISPVQQKVFVCVGGGESCI